MKQFTEKEYFIKACFSDNLQLFYEEYIKEKQGRAQSFFSVTSFGEYIHRYWSPSKICIASNEILTPDNIDVYVGYWYTIWRPIRKDLKKEYMEMEAYLCQMIDTSCNDCIFLKRDEKKCLKYNKEAKYINSNTIIPNNINCFQHRKKLIIDENGNNLLVKNEITL